MPVLRQNPQDRLLTLLESLQRRLQAQERKTATLTSLAAPSGAHAELAVFSDGKVGLRVYDSTGTLVHDLTA